VNWYLSLKTRAKLTLAFALTIVFTVGISILGIWAIRQIDDLDTHLYEVGVETNMAVAKLVESFTQCPTRIRDTIIETDRDKIQGFVAAFDNSKQATLELHDDLKEKLKNYPKRSKLLAEAKKEMDAYWPKAENSTRLALENKNVEAAYNMRNVAVPLYQSAIGKLHELQEFTRVESEEIAKSNTATATKVTWTLVICVIAALVISIILANFISNFLAKRMHNMASKLQSVANGDLTVESKANYQDELGDMADNLGSMVKSLRQLIGGIRQSIDGVASGSTQLSASAEQMNATTEQIAKSAEQQRRSSESMAAAMTELSASIDEVSNGSQSSLVQLDAALDATQQGNSAGNSTKGAMDDITHTTGRIAQAIGVIQELANQTNLLSLNAAIEAAKAGSQGKGFAVVAEEVRKLAERSASSAKEIAQYNIEARNSVEHGAEMVNSTVGLLHQIKANLDQFAVQTRESVASTREQSKAGVEVAKQVDSSVNEAASVASAATQMAATTGEVARTASELAGLASGLQNQVQRFKLA
jgi:methyl-accepting chemotaxis protein